MSVQPDQARAAEQAGAGWPRAAVVEPRRWRLYAAVATIAVIVIGGSIYLFSRTDNTPPPRQVRDLTVVRIIPPPPPPPPPQQMPEQKIVEQPKMVEPELKPIEQPKQDQPAKNDEPPGPLSLDAKAEGPGDLFRLGGHPGGSPFGGGGGSRWGWYASIVQSQIEAALRGNEKTRNAVMTVQIRLWADSTGRINRIQLTPSTGDAALDALMRNEVLGGLVLREPPPRDMPMPMILSVSERRPS